MSLRAVAVILFCFYGLGDFVIHSSARTKRQDVKNPNNAIEFFNNCSCVYHYQCNIEGFIITDGKGLLDARMDQGKKQEERGKRTLCIGGGFEGEFVCCKLKPGDEGKSPVTTEPSTRGTNTMVPVSVSRVCGRQLPDINVRIFNNEDELIPVDGEFPWLVAIFKKDTESQQWKFHASGSLIHPGVILTSNHVVVSAKANDLKVIANGHIKLSQIGDNSLHERNVKEIIKHPDYNSGMLLNDVSLLLLDQPYDLQGPPALNTLCLNPNITYENKRCLVAGWGRDAATGGAMKVLKKVELPTHSQVKCQEMLAKALGKSNYKFHESHMCAGGEEGKDACKGDGGSPLMCPTGNNNDRYQVGIVAWGIGCGKKDIPGVYANVQFLHNWIVDQLKQRDIYLENV